MKNGLYKGESQMPDRLNPGQWIYKPAGSAAWKSRVTHPNEKWEGVTPSGVAVQGWSTPRVTAYSVFLGCLMNEVVEFYVEKNVTEYPGATYTSYWRLARIKGVDQRGENRYNKYICTWIPTIWPKPSPDSIKSISLFLTKIKKLEEGEGGNFVEHFDAMNAIFKNDGAQFSCEIDSWEELPEGRFHLEEVFRLVEVWNEFLKMPDCKESKMEVSIRGR